MADPAKTSDELASIRTTLAEKRTLMAADRSLMAWIRTGLSMISFGFTIYKVLEGLRDSGVHEIPLGNPRTVGLFLIGLGTASIAAGTVEYWHGLGELRLYGPIRTRRPSFTIAMIMSATGLALFFGVAYRLL
jgi:putative membrane protein